jgi:clan AA aspartic protease
MGLIRTTVSLRAFHGSKKAYQALFLVDTGATDSMAPTSELKAAGIKAVGKIVYELADGTRKEMSYGLATIEFMGDTTAGRVIFGPEGTEPILGVTALESTGIELNPKDHTLKRLPAIPLKAIIPFRWASPAISAPMAVVSSPRR